MATVPDPAAARAARLREQIEKLTKKDRSNPVQTSEPNEGESPREFIHRRMRELDKKESG